MSLQQSRIIAIDPGVKTGVAFYDTKIETFDSKEYGEQQYFCDFAFNLVRGGAFDLMVCENFLITSKTHEKTNQPASLEIIGFLRWVTGRNGIPFVLQNPSDRVAISNDQLKKLGWYKGEANGFEGHADQAARHLGSYLMDRQDQAFLKRIYE